MSRTVIKYNTENVYIGPAPASGFHFLSENGVLSNDYTNTITNFNLIQPINRVQSISFSTSVERTNIKQMGKRGFIDRPITNYPSVDINIDYIQMGLINEYRMGFLVNYLIPSGTYSGQSYYSNNYSVSLLSGFFDKDNLPGDNQLAYPRTYRDKRNIFIGLDEYGTDVNNTSYTEIHPRSRTLNVIGFGNCYLNAYNVRASVGDLPRATVNYIGENISVYSSGSGLNIPAVESKSGIQYTDIYFNMPAAYEGNNRLAALKPGDITIDISSLAALTGISAIKGTGFSGISGTNLNIDNLFSNFNDIKIQSYNLSLPLDRQPLNSIGYKLPLDRDINFPILGSLSFDFIVGDLKSGSLSNLIKNDIDYNISLKLRNPYNYSNTGIAIQYDIRRAKFEGINYSNDIPTQKIANLDYSFEIDPDDLNKGLFMSGQLNVPFKAFIGYLLQEDDFYLLQEDDFKIVLDDFVYVL